MQTRHFYIVWYTTSHQPPLPHTKHYFTARLHHMHNPGTTPHLTHFHHPLAVFSLTCLSNIFACLSTSLLFLLFVISNPSNEWSSLPILRKLSLNSDGSRRLLHAKYWQTTLSLSIYALLSSLNINFKLLCKIYIKHESSYSFLRNVREEASFLCHQQVKSSCLSRPMVSDGEVYHAGYYVTDECVSERMRAIKGRTCRLKKKGKIKLHHLVIFIYLFFFNHPLRHPTTKPSIFNLLT